MIVVVPSAKHLALIVIAYVFFTVPLTSYSADDTSFEQATPIRIAGAELLVDGEEDPSAPVSVQRNHDLELSFYLSNFDWPPEDMVYVIQVVDSEKNWAIFIDTGNMSSGVNEEEKQVSLVVPVTHENPGQYYVQLFVLNDFDHPELLAPVLYRAFEITE